MTEGDKQRLSKLIEKEGLSYMLEVIAEISSDNARELRNTWPEASKGWAKASSALYKLSSKIYE